MDVALREFFAQEEGWHAIFATLTAIQTDLLKRAARAPTSDHALALGRLEGVEMALSRLREMQRKDTA
jgi:hypothetical protein